MLGSMSRFRRPDPGSVERVPGKESVWDYPRPPRLEPVTDRIRIVFAGVTIADTTAAYRVLETSHPPNYYLPPAAFVDGALVRTRRSSFCEWKGEAHYVDVVAGGRTAPTRPGGTTAPPRGSPPSPDTSPSTRARWTPASSATSR
jgi:uncharacterized protein (DUF427 family)